MARHVLAYNLTRVMNIMGTGPLLAAIRAWRRPPAKGTPFRATPQAGRPGDHSKLESPASNLVF
jgi:hypothetical protein